MYGSTTGPCQEKITTNPVLNKDRKKEKTENKSGKKYKKKVAYICRVKITVFFKMLNIIKCTMFRLIKLYLLDRQKKHKR